MAFYYPESTNLLRDHELWEPIREYFSSRSCSILDKEESNKLNFQINFETLITYGGNEVENFTCIPMLSRRNIPLPFDILDHPQCFIEEYSLSDVVEKFVQNVFGGEIYLLSGDRRNSSAIKMGNFCYKDLEMMSYSSLTNPFILYGKENKSVFLIDYDQNVNIISIPIGIDHELGEKNDVFWIDYFNDNSIHGVTGGDYHKNFININYIPRLPGACRLSNA